MGNKLIDEQLSEWLREAFLQALPELDQISLADIHVAPATDERFGDYQCNAAMGLAKKVEKSRRDIAESIVSSVSKNILVKRLEVAGPGFINIHLCPDQLGTELMGLATDDEITLPQVGAGQTIVIDYSSPNVAKPMHIGHIRSTVIGNALDRLHRCLGYRVIADNHLGDWGTQFGLLILGYRHFVDLEKLEQSPIQELERIYVRSYERSQDDPDWLDKARNELVRLQRGDPENLKLWESFVQLSVQEFERIYQRLGVHFDLVRGESFYREKLPGVVEYLQHCGLVEESEGAQVVRLDAEGLEVSIIRKRDGGYNYATTDLATVQSRIEEFNPTAIIYVTDERQQLHFKQFFTIAGKAGWQTKLVHVWFGLMRLPEATFSTRQGNVIKLEALLDEAEERALKLVQMASPDMSPEEQQAVAQAVGIGAVKYADLSQNPQSLVTFTWEKALAMDGNSAPYLQYAVARIGSVLAKYEALCPGHRLEDWPIQLKEPAELRLAKILIRFPAVVLRATELYRPSILCDYLYELAQAYSSFYQNVPFLKAPEGIRESRIRLGQLVAMTLRRGLGLLGIQTPERI